MNAGTHRLRAAFGAFSVLPVRASSTAPAGRVVLWLPVVGAALGALASLPALGVWRGHGRGAPLAKEAEDAVRFGGGVIDHSCCFSSIDGRAARLCGGISHWGYCGHPPAN